MYNWTTENKTIDQLYEIINLKEHNKETIGVDLYWKDSDIGVKLLIFEPGEILLSIDINRKYIDKETQLIDFNWYASKILPILCNAFFVTQYKFTFIY